MSRQPDSPKVEFELKLRVGRREEGFEKTREAGYDDQEWYG